MEIKYNVLVWTEDVGKFAKECLEKGVPKELNEALIFGNALRIEDLKALNEIPDLQCDVDREYAENKALTEIFLLGRCFEQSKAIGTPVGLAGFVSLSKETCEMAKILGIQTATFSSFRSSLSKASKKTGTKRTPKKKAADAGNKKAPAEKKVLEKREEKPKGVKDAGGTESRTHASKDTGCECLYLSAKNCESKEFEADKLISEIRRLLAKAKLPGEDLSYFDTPQNVAAIADAVRKASDENIGLPFQLQMRFGPKGAAVEQILKKNFSRLRGLEG